MLNPPLTPSKPVSLSPIPYTYNSFTASMSFAGNLRHTQSNSKPPLTTVSAIPVIGDDPLVNLSAVQARMDSLQKFLSDSVNSYTLLGQHQMNMVSDEITSAIHQIIVNGAALLSSNQLPNPPPPPPPEFKINPKSNHKRTFPEYDRRDIEDKVVSEDEGDCEIIELDAVELLAEHIHFCDFCGKGFKRDANLRMHMRAHGNQYKTAEALSKPEKCSESGSNNKRRRFSCPFVGCARNKTHHKFRSLKSVICVKNHFKRSHCPKMYSCTRCNKKSFSVLADLKNHLKHCGETKWKCSCGTSFSRKDKLFGHMALFEGHMPAVEGEASAPAPALALENEEDVGMDIRTGSDNGFLDRLMLDGFESIDSYCFQDLLGSSSPNGLNTVPDSTGWFS